jgi:hypothetical protein
VLKEAPCIAMEQSHHVCQYAFETIIALHHHYQTVILNQIYNDNQDEMSNKKGGGRTDHTPPKKFTMLTAPHSSTPQIVTNRNKTAKMIEIVDSLAGNRTPASCELFFRMTSRNTDHYTTKDPWVIDERRDLKKYYNLEIEFRTRAVP